MTSSPPRELVEFVSADEGRIACDRAEAAGFVVARIDAAALSTAGDFLRAIADALSFPEWFGMNWDALDESLRDLPIPPGDQVLVFVDRLEVWRARSDRDVELFLAIARDAIAHHAVEGSSFRVLVADAGVDPGRSGPTGTGPDMSDID